MHYAATRGHLEVVKWTYGSRNERCIEDLMDWAAARGHLEMVKWLYEKGGDCTDWAIMLAAKCGKS